MGLGSISTWRIFVIPPYQLPVAAARIGRKFPYDAGQRWESVGENQESSHPATYAASVSFNSSVKSIKPHGGPKKRAGYDE